MSGKCVKCGSNNNCSNSSACWCFSYPKILEVAQNSCYCKSCLTDTIQDRINELVSHIDDHNASWIKDLGPVTNPIEGIDYFMNDQGLMVLTKWYHLRRGSCCQSGCQECPY